MYKLSTEDFLRTKLRKTRVLTHDKVTQLFLANKVLFSFRRESTYNCRVVSDPQSRSLKWQEEGG